VSVVVLLGPLAGADCNLNGVEYAEDLATAASLDCNGDGLPDECEVPPLWTTLEEEFASGGELVRDLFLEDFSGDGIDDLGIGTAKGVFVWISAAGRLDERARQVFSPLEEKARNWTAGHLDSDGDLDLVTVLPGGQVQVLLNQGDATFSATTWVDPPFPVLIEDLPPPDDPPSDDEPTFALEIPPDTTVCGVFSNVRVGREPGVEYALKSTAHFEAGTLELPTRSDTLSADLFEEVRFGPAQERAEPLATGLFRIVRVVGVGGESVFRFNYEQSFTLPGGELFELRFLNLNFSR
jgi:hypothetical protein